MVKNKFKFEGNGDRKTPEIMKLIRRFGGGDGKGPSARTETDESESEGRNSRIDQGLGKH